jgi:hypothetical protein
VIGLGFCMNMIKVSTATGIGTGIGTCMHVMNIIISVFHSIVFFLVQLIADVSLLLTAPCVLIPAYQFQPFSILVSEP